MRPSSVIFLTITYYNHEISSSIRNKHTHRAFSYFHVSLKTVEQGGESADTTESSLKIVGQHYLLSQLIYAIKDVLDRLANKLYKNYT